MKSHGDLLRVMTLINEFKARTIAHPKHMSALEELINTIMFADSSAIIFVFGPTGVGKTKLLNAIVKYMIEISQDQMNSDPSFIPILATEARAPDTGIFNWKDFYIRFLEAAKDPLPRMKRNYDLHERKVELSHIRASYRDTSGTAYKNAYESFLIHRKPLAVLIDEAQHMQKMASGRRLNDQMDVIKNLSETTKTKHVLVGTYELLGLADLSAQLNRRTIPIHYSRYQHNKCDEGDFIIFQSVLLTFQNMLPLKERPDLVKESEYLYQNSAGCVGILKDWLQRALASALLQDAATLTLQHLKASALNSSALLRIATELRDGEKKMNENHDSKSAEALGIGNLKADVKSETAKQTPTKAKNHRPFNRNPERDVVGKRPNG